MKELLEPVIIGETMRPFKKDEVSTLISPFDETTDLLGVTDTDY
jgi:hypothetical protein